MRKTSEIEAEAEVISIHGAREHNLKNISLTIPRNQFVVVTGLSGSGKSTLAFDLLFAEGQRRFLDSMNVYARQFVEQLARPEVDLITGIPPAVSIEQRQSRGGGKSTVATVTEIYHFLRLLYARLGTQFCPKCQCAVQAQTRDMVGRRLDEEMKRRGDLLLLAPVVKNRKGFHTDVGAWAAKHGYAEVRADGKFYSTAETLRLDRFAEHDVDIVVGCLDRKKRTGARNKTKNRELIDAALKLGRGTLYALGNDRKTTVHSTERSCPECGDSFEPLDPKMFSYNSSRGWCPVCRGFGETFYLPEVERGARAEAIEESWFEWQEGDRETCTACKGNRLNPIACAVRLTEAVASRRTVLPAAPAIVDFSSASVDAAQAWFSGLKLKGRAGEIARDILPEIQERLKFLREVGLGYMQLGRGATSLSGGEAQRIRLAAQLGSTLSGVLYILDEPTIGLHARDNDRLLDALAMLKDRGNSLIVVEHDEETMRRADYIIDLGPAAGVHGGQVVASGTWAEILQQEQSVTGRWLRAKRKYPSHGQRRPVRMEKDEAALRLEGVSLHNLKNVSVTFPLHRFVCLTGVSGSGKSTLLRDSLLPLVKAKVLRQKKPALSPAAGRVFGTEKIGSIFEVDQSPIGRTLRSVPATYAGFFDDIRELFAQTPEARLRGYGAARFSFNSAQGRCPECGGAGTIKLEMNFMPPAFVRCETCLGTRFNRETLDIQFHHLNIAEILDLSVGQALEIFSPFPRIARALEALRDTGLDYIKLGQSSPTLSGGEAQRLKIVTHLLSGFRKPSEAKLMASQKSSLFLLEEPTVGLHMADVQRLVDALQRLVEAGHSVIVIEHNLELMAESDWIIDLGPEGGGGGGEVVGVGTPETLAKNKKSHTGKYLRRLLQKSRGSKNE